MEIQKNFFEILKSKLPAHIRLVDEVSETLKISVDSAYRRIRGEKELTLSELSFLCERFDISMDSVLNHQSNNIIFHQLCLNKNDMNNYYSYVKQISERLEIVASSKTKEIYYVAEDIPIFHIMPYAELMLFKVYVWHQTNLKNDISFDEFIQNLNQKELSNYYHSITRSYAKIPSNEVWAKDTIESTLYLFEYYYDLNRFNDKNTCILLCNQLLQVIDNIEQWAEMGKKGCNSDTPFKMYFSFIDPENSFMMTKREGASTATINLFIINGVTTSNESFCVEAEKWINGIVEKSLSLSGSAKRERFRFFQSMRTKITELIEKIER